MPHEYFDLMNEILNNYVFTLMNIKIAIQKAKILSTSKTCDMSDIAGIVYDDIKHPDNLLACERPFDVLWDPFLKYSRASI